MPPIKRLRHQRHITHPAATKDHRMDADALRLLPIRINHRAIDRRCSEAAIRVRGWRFARWSPVVPLPVDQMRRHLIRHPLPPDVSVVSQRDIGKDGIFRTRVHRTRVRLIRSAWRDTKEPGLRIDRIETTILTGLDPSNIVADACHFIALHFFGRNDHCKIRLTTGARERRGHIRLAPIRLFKTEDQHMLGHPTLIACKCRSNA